MVGIAPWSKTGFSASSLERSGDVRCRVGKGDHDVASDHALSRISLAVRGGERTFAFWSYVAAYAEVEEVKSAAEKMACEELDRMSILRKERRRAYHREHPGRDRTSVAKAVAEKIDAAALELRVARLLADLATRLHGAAAAHASQLSRESVEMSEQAAGVGSFSASVLGRDAPTLAEALMDTYLDEAERTHDAEKLTLLQKLAEAAIARLAWLERQPAG